MTLQFYRTEHQRLLDLLAQTDPRTEEYHATLNSIGGLDDVVLRCIDASEQLKYYEDEEAADAADTDNVVSLPVTTAERSKGKSKGKVEEEHPVTQPFPDPASMTKEEPAPLTLAEVKAAFTEAAKSGIKVSDIINDTGYAKLSEVPSELYAALMRSLERKKAGED